MPLSRRTLLSAAGSLLAQDAVRDPAPPSVAELPPVPAAKPVPHPGVRVHTAPRPLAKGAITEDWPSFLGPTHNGVSRETRLLHNWPASGPKLVWEMARGTGYGSPAISGGKLVYLHRAGDQERVECLDAVTGARFWEFAYPTRFEDRYGYNNGPRSSPVIDGDRVFTLGAEGKLHCLHLETGRIYWRRDLTAEFRLKQDFFGMSTTPLVEAGSLIVNLGAPNGPCVAAFDIRTGRLRWGAGKDWGASYASPVPAGIHGKRRVFVFAGGESQPPTGGLLMLDPATGAVDFTFPWRSRSYESVNAASPVVASNQVFLSASYRTGGAMIEVTPGMTPKLLWKNEVGTHFNTAVEKDGFLYAFDGRNEPDASLVCVEWKSGRVVWRRSPEWDESVNGRTQRLGTYRGTLLSVDGGFLCLGELGHLLWLDLSPDGYREVSRSWLFAARETWSAPVLSRGLLYVSQHSRDALHGAGPRLLCYDLRGK